MNNASGSKTLARIGAGLLLLGAAWLAQAAITITRADGAICTDGTINVDGTVTPVDATCSAPPPPGNFTLTVSKAGTGSGTVTGTGFSCGADCAESYPENTAINVTLTATANPGSTFSGWSGQGCSDTDTCTVNTTITGNLSVTATFTADAPPPGACGAPPPGVVVVDTGNMRSSFAKQTYTPALPSTIYAFKVKIDANYIGNSSGNATKGVSSDRTKRLVVSTCPGVLTPVNDQGACNIGSLNVSTARMSGNQSAPSYVCKLPNAAATDYYINAVSKENLSDPGYTCSSPATCAFAFDRSGGG